MQHANTGGDGGTISGGADAASDTHSCVFNRTVLSFCLPGGQSGAARIWSQWIITRHLSIVEERCMASLVCCRIRLYCLDCLTFVLNHYTFDSYSIAWDQKQIILLIFNLIALAVPFAFAGMLIGALLSLDTASASQIYGANLLGSAAGALAAPIVISIVGSEQTVVVCMSLGLVAAGVLNHQRLMFGVIIAGIGGCCIVLITNPDFMQVQPSPYKQLSHFRRNPDATVVATHQNAYSRMDVIDSTSIHSFPGLSLTYLGDLPKQTGLIMDGANLFPVSDASATTETLLQSVPAAVAYRIRPDANSLILGSAGGFDAFVALANGAQHVTMVEPNELVVDALSTDLRIWAGLVDDPRVTLQHDQLRVFARNTPTSYDIVHLTLRDNYQPVNSGAFSLSEDYTLTVEAIQAYLNLLDDDGVLVMTRWLQDPTSESLRMLALILEALDSDQPEQHIVAFRTFQLMTFIVKPEPIDPGRGGCLTQSYRWAAL